MKWYARTPYLIIVMLACCLLGEQSKANAGPTDLTITTIISQTEYNDLLAKYNQLSADFQAHLNDTSNPHQVTKSQIGLGNVDNVKQIPMSEKGANGGVASLDNTGKISGASLVERYALEIHDHAGTYAASVHNHDASYVQKTGNSAVILGDFYKKSGSTCFNIPSGWQVVTCP